MRRSFAFTTMLSAAKAGEISGLPKLPKVERRPIECLIKKGRLNDFIHKLYLNREAGRRHKKTFDEILNLAFSAAFDIPAADGGL